MALELRTDFPHREQAAMGAPITAPGSRNRPVPAESSSREGGENQGGNTEHMALVLYGARVFYYLRESLPVRPGQNYESS